jgi:Tfp pilus assembly protein PilX
MCVKAWGRRHSPGDERGFSLILAIVVLTAATLLLFGAIDAVLQNAGTTRTDLDQKRALLAAQAGLSSYEQQLSDNPSYWTACPGPNGTTGVTSTTGQTGATVPGSTDAGSTEYYEYATLPATGTTYAGTGTGCSTANPIASVIQGATSGNGAVGTFRVKVTGISAPTSGSARIPISRTLVAQFKTNSFLSYVYFTNYEDEDPLYAVQSGGSTIPETEANCAVYAWAGRSSSLCQSIPFGVGDSVNGPLHSNDTVTCNSSNVTFGRTSADPIETPDTLSANGCTGTITGTQENQANDGWQQLPLPPDDTQLAEVAGGGNASLGSSSSLASDCSATAGCVFDGPTTIVLDGPESATNTTNQMTVTNCATTTTLPCTNTATLPYPNNGVVYVNSTASCNYSYSPWGSGDQLYGGTTLDTNSADTDNAGCGDAVVSSSTSTSTCPGTTQVTVNGAGVCPYTKSLTIGAANDIIIAGSLPTTTTSSGCGGGESSCPTGTAMLGLIANDMIRIYHPLTGVRNSDEEEYACPSTNNTNGPGSLVNPLIDAAIFSVEHSFIIDNFDCGNGSNTASSCPGYANATSPYTTALCQLTINGAIAQDFRGRIGESQGAASNYSGYIKNYWYDQRLQNLAPPDFLNPVDTGWQVDRVTECDVAGSC